MKIYNFFVMPHPPIAVAEVGRGEERKIQATVDACQQVAQKIAKIEPDTIVLVTPHGPMFSDAVAISAGETISGSLAQFGTPQVALNLAIDQDLTQDIIVKANQAGLPLVEITPATARRYGVDYSLDHGSLVPLYFINQAYQDYKLVHITYGLLDKGDLYQVGKIIQEAAEEASGKIAFIASADLSHRLKETGPYDYSPYGEQFDQEILAKLEAGDLDGIMNMDPIMVEEAGQCGLPSFYIMLGTMDGLEIQGKRLSYEGTFGVGYGVMEFALDPYVQLAKKSLAHYLSKEDYLPIPQNLPEEMLNTTSAVFVTLYKEGDLRGCIGTILPRMENLASEIVRNAVAAGLEDPRFPPVAEGELAELEISVDVLTQPQPANRSDLDPKRYGIIVSTGARRGLLLPDIEGVDTVAEQLRIALAKGGISPEEDYLIESFEVLRHS